jgi:hypothetical protein
MSLPTKRPNVQHDSNALVTIRTQDNSDAIILLMPSPTRAMNVLQEFFQIIVFLFLSEIFILTFTDIAPTNVMIQHVCNINVQVVTHNSLTRTKRMR